MKDTGYWFVQGRVTDEKDRNRVWAAHKAKWDAIYAKQIAENARHRAAEAAIQVEFDALKEPYTPWVGRKDEVPIEEFLEEARKEYRRRKAANETADY